MRKTEIISAFPACGKSYCCKNYSDLYEMIDSDSSEFSWVKDSDGNNTKQRNPDFPDNYIKHIKDNLGKCDIIFISSHEVVRKALEEQELRYTLIYPRMDMKDEFMTRYKNRGNDEIFIKFICENWEKFILDLDKEDWPARLRISSHMYEYITPYMLGMILSES